MPMIIARVETLRECHRGLQPEQVRSLDAWREMLDHADCTLVDLVDNFLVNGYVCRGLATAPMSLSYLKERHACTDYSHGYVGYVHSRLQTAPPPASFRFVGKLIDAILTYDRSVIGDIPNASLEIVVETTDPIVFAEVVIWHRTAIVEYWSVAIDAIAQTIVSASEVQQNNEVILRPHAPFDDFSITLITEDLPRDDCEHAHWNLFNNTLMCNPSFIFLALTGRCVRKHGAIEHYSVTQLAEYLGQRLRTSTTRVELQHILRGTTLLMQRLPSS